MYNVLYINKKYLTNFFIIIFIQVRERKGIARRYFSLTSLKTDSPFNLRLKDMYITCHKFKLNFFGKLFT